MTFILLRIILQWLRRRACVAEVKESATGLVFTARGLKRCYAFFIALSLSVVGVVLDFREAIWLAAFPTMFAVGCLANWPADIVLNSHGLTQREWWGRTRQIAWDEIQSIVVRSRDASTFVFNANGTAIRHSGCHANSRRFQAEVMARSGLSQTADWDAIPSLQSAIH
jgi:hypothetical protein